MGDGFSCASFAASRETHQFQGVLPLDGVRRRGAAADFDPEGGGLDPELAESEGKLALSEGKLAESDDKLAESDDKLAPSEGKLAESEGKLAESEGKLAESEGKLAESEGKLALADAERRSLASAGRVLRAGRYRPRRPVRFPKPDVHSSYGLRGAAALAFSPSLRP